MTNQINGCNTIEELHALWKELHKTQPAPYLPANVPAHAFLPDGIISEELYNKSTRILFVGKEAYWYWPASHKLGTLEENSKFAEEENLYFWHREVAFKKRKETIFSKRLSLLVNAINSNDFETVNKDHECLKSIAFINLNKRGGYNYCVWDVLAGYVEQYAECIAREISLTAPNLIVCCGRDVKWLLDEFVVKHLSCTAPILSLHHPSYFAISDKKYLLELKSALGGIQNKT